MMLSNFPMVTGIIPPQIRHFRFSIFALETLELEWQCSQYLELNPTRANVAIPLISIPIFSPRLTFRTHITVPTCLSWDRGLFLARNTHSVSST